MDITYFQICPNIAKVRLMLGLMKWNFNLYYQDFLSETGEDGRLLPLRNGTAPPCCPIMRIADLPDD